MTQPPLQLNFYDEDGMMRHDLAFHRSLWTEPGSPGRVAAEGVMARVKAKGCKRP